MPRPMLLLLCLLLTLSQGIRCGRYACADDHRSAQAGTVVRDFSLWSHLGRQHHLREFADKPIVVVAFLGTQCPLAKLYGGRLLELADRFAKRGVVLIGINSNAQDSLQEISAYVREHKLTFPMLKDPDHRVADLFQAVRTPEVFVLDAERRIRYQGPVDDQYAIGVKRDEPRTEYLREALNDLLEGREVARPSVPSIGCHIGRTPTVEPHGEVTFSSHIAAILKRRCVSCHRPGQNAPFPLMKYDDVAGWSTMIREVVEEERMPPWFADSRHGQFRNDARMPAEEKKLLLQWIRNGCPQGDSTFRMRSVDSDVGNSQWQIPAPHQVLHISPRPHRIPATGEVEYKYFTIDPGFREDRFVSAVEVLPSNREVVHHALVSIADPNSLSRGVGNCGVLMNYAPGMQPTKLPAGVAIRIPAGAKLLVQMHYTPNGSPQTDRTAIGLVFAPEESVTHCVEGGAVVNPAIVIPPQAKAHTELAAHQFDKDVRLLSLSPHMHLRGKAFRIDAKFPSGKTTTLLDIPRYDFNWQLRYVLAKPLLLPAGTRLICTAVYDNSETNLANPNPNATVTWGDQTTDEMLIGFFSALPVDGALLNGEKEPREEKQPRSEP